MTASQQLTVAEIGVFHGHTTAVLAAVFQQVIAVDVEESHVGTTGKLSFFRTRVHQHVTDATPPGVFERGTCDWRLGKQTDQEMSSS